MTYAISDQSTWARSAFSASVTPVVSGTWNVGDLGVIVAGANPVPVTPNTPSGWTSTAVQTGTNNSLWLYSRIMQLGDTVPAITWGSSQNGACACAAMFSGNQNTLTGIVDKESDSGLNSTKDLSTTGSLVPANDGCLVLYAGIRSKTATSNGTTFTSPANFTTIDQFSINGTTTAGLFSYWIQTTATAFGSAGGVGSIADGSTQATRGFRIAFIPAAAPPPPPGPQTIPSRLIFILP